MRYGLAAILILIGVKMLIEPFWPVSIGLTLGMVAVILALSVLLSLVLKRPA